MVLFLLCYIAVEFLKKNMSYELKLTWIVNANASYVPSISTAVLVLRSSLHTLLYKAEDAIHASPHSSISLTRKRFKGWRDL